MRGVKDERGAVAVVVALVMVPLIAFAAISLDVAGLWWERQQLQTGADAGALAIAQDCGRGSCGTPAATASAMATANHRGAGAAASVVRLTSGSVTVRTDATRTHAFARVLGVDSTGVSARSTAAWGAPSGGTGVLPLAFSWCEWRAQTNGAMPSGTTATTILFPKTSETGCTGPSGNFTPGGFGWLRTDGTSCTIKSAINDNLAVDPGISAPSSCSNSYVGSLLDKPVLLPLFDRISGTGSSGQYHVYGYAAFVLTGYYLGGQYKVNAPCTGNDRCIRGYFTRFVSPDESFTYSPSAPDFGAEVVKLVPQEPS